MTHVVEESRGVYLNLIEGESTLGNENLSTGDAAKVTGQMDLRIRARGLSEVVLVDVPLVFDHVGIWQGHI